MNALELRRRTLGKGVYKKTVEGNPAIAQGSLARRYLGITMQGWTEQTQYEGKNLLPVDVGQSFTGKDVRDSAVFAENGVTVSYNDISPGERRDIYMFGDGVSSISESSYVDIPEITPGKYHICNDSARINFYVVVWRNSASVMLGFSATSTTPITIEEGDKFRIFFTCNNPIDGVQEYTIHPMLVKDGGELTTYEPYTGGQPSPNPDYPQEIVSAGKMNEETQKYKYQVKLTGKNLIPTYSEYSDWMAESYKYIPVSGFTIGETYTFSQSVVPELGTGLYVALGTFAGRVNIGTNYWLYHSTVQNLCVKSITFVATQETYYLNVAGFNSTSISRFLSLFPDLMVELGTERTEYEPYKEQTVTLTSDRPLTKWDKLKKRNGQWGWVYKSAEIVLDGSEKWQLTGATSDEYQGFALKSSDYNAMESNLRLVCDKFAYSTSDKINTCRQEKSEYGLRFVVSTEYVPNKTVAEFKNWLQSNPITVLYQLAEPVFVPLSASEQEQMNELYTFRPTTVLSNDCGCNMTLTYKTKKSLEVAT